MYFLMLMFYVKWFSHVTVGWQNNFLKKTNKDIFVFVLYQISKLLLDKN